uniref:Neur_chan_LBD domain-containing protein n=1 Tax=Macrostomum lignano TaxID=282301 RepID=A0A1I8JNT9_9PLAT
DKQACPLLIGSYAYDSKNLVYVWWEEAKSKSALHQIPANVINSTSKNLGVEVTAMAQFLFRPEGVAFSHELSKLGSETRDVLSLTIPLERMIGYYLLQIYLPSYMTVSMHITTLLTSVTISLTGRHRASPKVPYATALDVFLFDLLLLNVFSAPAGQRPATLEIRERGFAASSGWCAGGDTSDQDQKPADPGGASAVGGVTAAAVAVPARGETAACWQPDPPSGRPERWTPSLAPRTACLIMFLNCLKGNRKYMLMKERLRPTGPEFGVQNRSGIALTFPHRFVFG